MSEIAELIKKEIIQSPDFESLVQQKVNQAISCMNRNPEYYTREQLAKLWQVSRRTVDRMSDEALRDRGYCRVKIGNSVRFKMI